MEASTPVRMKRRRAPDAVEPEPAEAAEAAEPAEAAEAAEPAEAAEAAPEAPQAAPSRGLVRKSAVRRLLKQEFPFPLQVREAYFSAMEARFSEDVRRSVARAREQKRSTLMASDA